MRHAKVCVDSLPALIGLVPIEVLEIHTWNARLARVEPPDRMSIDPGRITGRRGRGCQPAACARSKPCKLIA